MGYLFELRLESDRWLCSSHVRTAQSHAVSSFFYMEMDGFYWMSSPRSWPVAPLFCTLSQGIGWLSFVWVVKH